jgi:hypothetical protein
MIWLLFIWCSSSGMVTIILYCLVVPTVESDPYPRPAGITLVVGLV